MLRLLLTLVLTLITTQAWAAHITTDVVNCTQTGTDSTSGDCTVAADAKLALIIVGLRDGGGAVSSVNSVTVEGQAASLISGCAAGTGQVRTEIWQLASPPTGAGTTIAVSATGGTIDQMVTGLITLKNTALSNIFGVCGTGAANSANADINSLASSTNDLAVMGVTVNGNRTCAPDATSPVSTEQYDAANGVNMHSCGYTEVGTSPTVDMRVDLSASDNHAEVAVSVRHFSPSGSYPIFLD